GIVTTFAVVAGFAGYGAEGAGALGGIAVMLLGLANLFADATAIGLGEFLSGRSARDAWRATRARELAAPRGGSSGEGGRAEAAALRLLTGRGLPAGEARAMAPALARNPEFLADLLMHYEARVAAPDGDVAAARGLATFTAFLAFGLAPLL